jgi:hypothetical protein
VLADLVLLGNLGDRTAVSFPQNRDHLFLGKTALLHRLPFCAAGAILSTYDWS